MTRLRYLWAGIATVMIGGMAFADFWSFPEERYRAGVSENGRFAVYVTPANGKVGDLLEVVEIRGKDERVAWKSKWWGEYLPLEAYVSDDGANAVTVNEMGQVGYGNYALCFFDSRGMIKNYSMKEALHLPEETEEFELHDMLPATASSLWWDEHSVKFFDRSGSKVHFCTWLGVFRRWAAWDAMTGKAIEVDKKMVDRWNGKARLLAIRQVKEGSYSASPDGEETPYVFLGWLKRLEDRRVIEQLLSDENFWAACYSPPGFHWTQYSSKRSLGERLLAEWDGKATECDDARNFGRQVYHHLGVVEGEVILPEVQKVEGVLWVFLVPEKVEKGRWHGDSLVHRLVVRFERHFPVECWPESSVSFGFALEGVTPGKYWLKAVWDKVKPCEERGDAVARPGEGDYESVDSPVVTVEAGGIVEDVVIDCTHEAG